MLTNVVLSAEVAVRKVDPSVEMMQCTSNSWIAYGDVLTSDGAYQWHVWGATEAEAWIKAAAAVSSVHD